jgi:phosphoserine aminotransferase
VPEASTTLNFSAGPAILHPSIFARAAAAVLNLPREGGADQPPSGLSILEVSHRDRDYTAINTRAIELCHEVLEIPETHRVLFLQGGATLQFGMIPLNYLDAGKTAYYMDTGVWSAKAFADAEKVGDAQILASSKATNYDRIPEIGSIPAPERAAYVHTTTNNTIYGTEYREIPAFPGVMNVVDCSSHIGSRPLDFSRVDFGYAGAQKNLGPSGVAVVFARKELLEKPHSRVPAYLDYASHAKEPGLFNTPNTFGVLVLKFVLEWMKEVGGLAEFAKRNAKKAQTIYDYLDQSQLFAPRALAGHRSQMNVCFTLRGENAEASERLTRDFLALAAAQNMSGLRGHRLAGGCRASIYNAFPQSGVDQLVEVMREFERTH